MSGLSVEEADPRLEEAFAERAQREILVTVEDQEAIRSLQNPDTVTTSTRP